MTQDDILRMARECGHWTGQTVEMNDVGLERFAALVAAAERGACAQVCVEISNDYWMGDAQFEAATRCLNAIRARSNP